jgi:hypothetical protein
VTPRPDTTTRLFPQLALSRVKRGESLTNGYWYTTPKGLTDKMQSITRNGCRPRYYNESKRQVFPTSFGSVEPNGILLRSTSQDFFGMNAFKSPEFVRVDGVVNRRRDRIVIYREEMLRVQAMMKQSWKKA